MSEPYNVTIGWTMSADDAWLHGFRGLTVAQARERWAARGYDSADLTTLPTDAADDDVVSGWGVRATWSNHPGPCAAFVGDPRLELHVVSGTTEYESWTWDAGQEYLEHPYGEAGPVQVLEQAVAVGPETGANGTPYCGAFSSSRDGTPRIACDAGTRYRFSAWYQMYGESWPETDHGQVNGSWGLRWFDDAGNLLQTDIVATYAAVTQDGPFHGPDMATIEAPAGAVCFRLVQSVDSSYSVQPLNNKIDQVTVQTVRTVNLPPVATVPAPQRLVTCDEWDGMNSVPQVLPDGVERV